MCSFQPLVEEDKLSLDLFIFYLLATPQTIMVLNTRKLFWQIRNIVKFIEDTMHIGASCYLLIQ